MNDPKNMSHGRSVAGVRGLRSANGTDLGISWAPKGVGLAAGAKVTAQTLPFIVAAIEFAAVTIATFGAAALYHEIFLGRFPYPLRDLLATLCLAGIFVVSCGWGRDYSLKRLLDPKEQFRSLLIHWHTACSIFVFALFMTHATDFYSRGAIVAQYVGGLAAAVIVRFLAVHLTARGLRSGRLRGRRVVVIGDPTLVSQAIPRLKREGLGADVVSVVELDRDRLYGDLEVAKNEVAHGAHAIEQIARSNPIDDVLISMPWAARERIRAFVDGLAAVPAAVHLAPDQGVSWAPAPVASRIGYFSTVRLSRAPMTLRDRSVKRAFDLILASTLLLLTAPLLALIALVIKLDTSGPLLFRQRRHGFNQEEFRVFKFRTMTTLEDGPVIRQATPRDERVTRIGRFLRSSNLDELPQLFNVLAGSMSFVGPRPHAVAHNNEYEEQIGLYARRHNVKPGITGWAQVNGFRGQTDSIDKMRRRVEHDLFYIDHWSLAFDVKILFMTVLSPSSYRNAF